MKRVQIFILTALMSLFGLAEAMAGDRALGGMLIGAGSGAIIGQAAGQNTESVLLGTAIGGVVGYAVGNSLERDLGVVRDDRYRSIPRYREHRSWGHDHYTPPPYFRGKPNKHYYDYKDKNRFCRQTVTTRYDHGRISRVLTTTCDKPYYRDRYRDRYHDRDYYRYHRYRDGDRHHWRR